MILQNGVDLARELPERHTAKARPMAGEKMIIEHVHHDARKPAPRRADETSTGAHDLMVVGVTVDLTVQQDALAHARSETPIHTALHEIAQ